MAKKHVGTIVVPPGAFITKHEKLAADFLAIKFGYDITFLAADRHKHVKTPDIEMLGLRWEIKSPKGKSSRTIENNLRSAQRQSVHIILDLRRMDGRVPITRFVSKIAHQFKTVQSIQHIIVITKQEEIIDFKR